MLGTASLTSSVNSDVVRTPPKLGLGSATLVLAGMQALRKTAVSSGNKPLSMKVTAATLEGLLSKIDILKQQMVKKDGIQLTGVSVDRTHNADGTWTAVMDLLVNEQAAHKFSLQGTCVQAQNLMLRVPEEASEQEARRQRELQEAQAAREKEERAKRLAQEEERRRQMEEARKKELELEARRKAEEERQRAERAAQERAEEEKRRRELEEAKAKQLEAERVAAEKAAAEEKARRAREAKERKAREAEERKREEEETLQRLSNPETHDSHCAADDEEQPRKREEEQERARKAAEKQAQLRKKKEEEAQRKKEEKQREEEEKKRKAEEKHRAEQEQKRKAEARRKAQLAKQQEAKKRAAEREASARAAEEARKLQEEEDQKAAQEKALEEAALRAEARKVAAREEKERRREERRVKAEALAKKLEAERQAEQEKREKRRQKEEEKRQQRRLQEAAKKKLAAAETPADRDTGKPTTAVELNTAKEPSFEELEKPKPQRVRPRRSRPKKPAQGAPSGSALSTSLPPETTTSASAAVSDSPAKEAEPGGSDNQVPEEIRVSESPEKGHDTDNGTDTNDATMTSTQTITGLVASPPTVPRSKRTGPSPRRLRHSTGSVPPARHGLHDPVAIYRQAVVPIEKKRPPQSKQTASWSGGAHWHDLAAQSPAGSDMFNIAHAVRVINSQRVVEADFSEAVDVGDLVRRAVKRDALALEAVWAKQGGAVGTAWGKPEWSEQTQAVWKGASHWSPGVPEILSKAVVPYSMLPIRHLGEAPAPPSPSVSGETHNQQDLEQEGAS